MNEQSKNNSIEKLVQYTIGKNDVQKKDLEFSPEELEMADLLRSNRDLMRAMKNPTSKKDLDLVLNKMKSKGFQATEEPKVSIYQKIMNLFTMPKLPILVPTFAIVLFIAILGLKIGFSEEQSSPISWIKSEDFYKSLTGLHSYELPVFVAIGSNLSALEFQRTEVLSFYEAEKDYKKIISKYRPVLNNEAYKVDDVKKELERLYNVASKERDKNSKDPFVWNNIGLIYYYVADAEIRYYLSNNEWRDKKIAEKCLEQSKNAFQKALSLSKKQDEKILFNLSAVRIAGLHLEGKIQKETISSILSEFIYNENEVVNFLFSESAEIPAPDINLKESSLSPSLRKFIVVYLLVLNYSYFEELASEDLPEQVEKEKLKLVQIMGRVVDKQPEEDLWMSEVKKIKERMDK